MLSTDTTKAKRMSAPKRSRAKCTQCGKSFQLTKTFSPEKCIRCRREADEEGKDPAEPEVTATIPLPESYAAAASTKTWNSLLEDPETARSELLQKPVLTIGPAVDDYASLDNNSIMRFSKQIFDALLAPPVQPPNHWDDEKKDKYRTSQLNAFARCSNAMLTDEDQSDASARCRLVVHDAIKLHENGLLINELTREARASFIQDGPINKKGDPTRFKTGASLLLDVGITCSERINKIIEAVRKNKIVAEDVLDGFKTLDIVRCPTAFLDCKITNFTGNSGKHADEKAGGDLRRKKETLEKEKLEKEAAAATLVDLSQAGVGEKRKASEVEQSGGALHVENAKRMRMAGIPLAQTSPQPHDGYGQLPLEGFDDTTAFETPETHFYHHTQQFNGFQQPTFTAPPMAFPQGSFSNVQTTQTNPFQSFSNSPNGAFHPHFGNANYHHNLNYNVARPSPNSGISTPCPAPTQGWSDLSGAREGKWVQPYGTSAFRVGLDKAKKHAGGRP